MSVNDFSLPENLPVEGNSVFSSEFCRARIKDLKARLKKKRFEHSLRVADTAVSLAKTYKVDASYAYLAGLLHDWDKNFDNAGAFRRAKDLGIDVSDFKSPEMSGLLHGPSAARALALSWPSIPPEVLQAIERHTAADPSMTDLDMVVYIADAIEPGRDIFGLDDLREMAGHAALPTLFIRTYRQVMLYLISNNKHLHPVSIAVYNAYIDCYNDGLS